MCSFRSILSSLFTAVLLVPALASAVFAAPPNDNFANAETLSGVRVKVTRTNSDATKEPGEPNHANNVGGKSVWFKWTAPMSRIYSFGTAQSGTNLDTIINIYAGSNMANLNSRTFSNDIYRPQNVRSFVRMLVAQGTTLYIAVDGFHDGSSVASGEFTLDIKPEFIVQGADYDDDGITDPAIFRPSDSSWRIAGSFRSFTRNFGTSGDIPVVGTRSSTSEINVYRPSEGTWYIDLCCGDRYVYWGTGGDTPVTENFGAETSTAFTVFRPSEGMWYLHGHGAQDHYYRFGQNGDIPVPAQYTADAFADIAVFRPSNATWYFIKRVNGNPGLDQFGAVQFGIPGDKPVPADYDGDGVVDVAVFRPATGFWWVLRSSDQQVGAFQWGLAGDIPATGDYDGDGRFDYAVFRPSEGRWYIFNSGSESYRVLEFGAAGDVPVTSNLR